MKRFIQKSAAILALTLPVMATAGGLNEDAAIGGAVGGALGGVIGAELGGRDGAIVGASIGAALGTQVGTRDRDDHRGYELATYGSSYAYTDTGYRSHPGKAKGVPHNRGSFCPPGQAKKGRCH